ncbi:MAG: NAD(P)-dependent oxidoreductase [Acidobacteriota bacterium]|nr:NAD(P)-dependent oxidoreductase [Acidobacteriota bacterium]
MANNKPVLLILGGCGFLGESLSRAADDAWEVWRAGPAADGAGSISLDVRDRESVRRAFSAARPSLVAHLAAISDIDRCQREPRLAWEVNAGGTQNVVDECVRTGARLVFSSSSAVFDGLKHGYAEDDRPNPLSVYGQTKLEGERLVAARLPSAIVLRMSLVLGVSRRRDTNSTLSRWVAAWRTGTAVAACANEYRNPVDSGTLARVILELGMNPGAAGIYHAGASNSLSRYEIARLAAEALGYSSSLVIRQDDPPPARAPRGLDHFLLTEHLRKASKAVFGDTQEVIRRSLVELTAGTLRTRI